jgi:hypothetical protein
VQEASEAQRMYDARTPTQDIAEHFGMSRSTLYGYLDRSRLQQPRTPVDPVQPQ